MHRQRSWSSSDLRSGVGHHSGFGDCAFIFSVAHHRATIADNRIAGADAPPGAAKDQCLGRVRVYTCCFLFAANPKKVVDLLVGVANAHPQVLKNPAVRTRGGQASQFVEELRSG